MPKSRIEQREELLESLKELIAPLKQLAESSDPRDYQRAPIVRQDFRRDGQVFCGDLAEYCRLGDYVFDFELSNLQERVRSFLDCLHYLGTPENSFPNAKQALDNAVQIFKDGLRRIPCEDHATVIPPATPFAASRRIRAICGEAQKRIGLFDPYVSTEVLYRYLPAVPPAIPFTVVTEAVSPSDPNKKNHRRWDELKALVPMVQVEYPQFQLLVLDSLHDRWLRVDDVAYHLGGSVKDAGKNDYYTISTLDPSLAWHLDDRLGKAKPWDTP